MVTINVGDDVYTTPEYYKIYGKNVEGKVVSKPHKNVNSLYATIEVTKPNYLEGDKILISVVYLEKRGVKLQYV